MAVTAKKRKLFQVAKELNLSSGTITEFLQKKGHEVRGPNTPISDEVYEEILQRFAHEKKIAEKLHKRRMQKAQEEARAHAEKATAEVETPEAKEEEPVAEAEPAQPEAQPAAEATTEETAAPAETPETEEQPAVAEAETEVETPEPVAEEPEVTETPVEAAPEAEAMETAEAVETAVEPEPVEEKTEEKPKPKVGDIIDHPGAERYKKELERREREKRERQKEALKRIKKSGKKALEEKKKGEKPAAEAAEVKGKDKKKEKKKHKETPEEREARRKKAFEMIRKESQRLKKELRVTDEEEEVLPKEPKKKRSKKKKVVDQKEVEESLKKTLAEIRDTSTGKKRRKKVKTKTETGEEIEENVIKVSEFITTQELAEIMDVPATEIIKKCLELGLIVTINQRLDLDTIKLLAEEFGYKVEEEEEFASEIIEEIAEEKDNPEDLQPRPPVVTIMGHVDHGKTSLLDYIRNTNVVAGEAGGITQHIGAYEVELEDGRKITFLDTPGHEAFTAMRARGAQVTDIVVLVVAADDRVMPQTEEAIDHAKAAGVPIVIAINKIDKPNADPQAIRQQLAERNILVEDWGGPYQVAEVSAKTGQGVDDLLEKILLEAEMLDLKANPNKKARGVVLEARLDKGKGPIATVLIQEGTLKVGDIFVVGQHWGRVRALLNERNQRVESAGPSTPVQVLGIDGVPEAGDRFIVLNDEKKAREIAQRRQQIHREQMYHQKKGLTLDEFSRRMKEGEAKELKILVKADVDGSAQALADALTQLSVDEVKVDVIRRAVGPITETDVLFASASESIIIGFHVRPTAKAKELAEREHVDIRLYRVIYEAIDDVKKALEGMLEPVEREVVLGTAEVRQVFKISRVGTVAGCYVLNGKIVRNARVRLIRNDVEIYEGRLSSLKRFKEDVREVAAGYECGLTIENYNDIKVGDIIEAFEIVQESKTLEQAKSQQQNK